MQSLINTIKSLFGTSAELSHLELAMFNAVREKLNPPEAELWDKQLAAINKIHRSPDGREINLYVMRGGKSDFPRELRFTKIEEFKIAVVDVEDDSSGAKLRGRVWCVGGHVFSIEFKSSFEDFEKTATGERKVHCDIETYPA